MLRRIFAFLILGGLVAVCSCEPVNRKLRLEAARIIGCTDNDDASVCGTSQTIDASVPETRGNQTRTGRKLGRAFLVNSDDPADEGKKSCSSYFSLYKSVRNVSTNLDIYMWKYAACEKNCFRGITLTRQEIQFRRGRARVFLTEFVWWVTDL